MSIFFHGILSDIKQTISPIIIGLTINDPIISGFSTNCKKIFRIENEHRIPFFHSMTKSRYSLNINKNQTKTKNINEENKKDAMTK